MLRTTGLRAIPPALAAAFLLLFGLALGGLFLSVSLSRDAQKTAQLQMYGRAIADVITYTRDAETGQRGYLLTHQPEYLKPFVDSQGKVEPALVQVRDTQARVGRDTYDRLAPSVFAKMAELRQTVALEQ